MFAPEIQQIQAILEAESANAPFAFSVPQEVVDQILRLGSNTEQHRMVISMDFMKQKSIEQVADHLREIYLGGNGLTVKGKKYAVWYDTDGLRIAAGTSARYANMAQILSWEDAARRIGDLMDAGQFATPLEIAEAPAYERRQAAEILLYLRQDLSDGAVTQGFLPSLATLSGGGFPEKTAELTERLAHADFCETLDNELIAFHNACQQDRDLLRFHFHSVEDLLTRTEELMLPHLDYTSNLEKIPEAEAFISEDEIAAALSSGKHIESGKDRIYRYFTTYPAHTTKEKADFLKHEYGNGGYSHALSGSTESMENHDNKGIKLSKTGCSVVHMSWIEVAKRIDRLVSLHRYLTSEEEIQFQQNTQRNSLFNAYNVVKESHPDDMVLYQVGDFFELYGEDARIAAPMLGLTLTSRSVSGAGWVDMCGFPIHRLEQYVELLRDKYDVTISAVDRDSQERSVSSRPSIDHEAERAIDAYEAEFGADGTRVFGSSTIRPEEDTPAPRRTEITQEDIDAALQRWNGDAASKRTVVRRLREGASREEMLQVIRDEYGNDLAAFPVKGESGAHDVSWAEIRDRVLDLITEDRFFTEEEQDALEDIDPIYIRERLAEYGIVNGEVVDPEKSSQSPFIRQGEASAAQIAKEEAEQDAADLPQAASPDEVYNQYLPIVKSLVLEDTAYQNACKNSDRANAYLEGDAAIRRAVSTIQAEDFMRHYYDQQDFRDRLHRDILETTYAELSSIQPLQELNEQPASQAPAYQVGDTVFLEDGKPFVIEKIGPLGVELRDPSLAYPVLRAESRESFARLMEQYPQPQKQPEVRSESVTVYPAEENGLPYDVVIERMGMSPKKESAIPHRAQNFHITDDSLSDTTTRAKYANNIAAIRTLRQIEAEHRRAGPEEQKVLARYTGWGGLPQVFNTHDAAWSAECAELSALLTPEEYQAARASTMNAHFTPPTVIRAIYETIGRMGFTTGNILEPSMGVGNFFGLLPEEMSASRLYGVELDSITGRIAQQLYPNAHITVAGFESTNHQNFYDLVVGNVPFGNYKVSDPPYDKHHFYVHDYFIAKAIDQVRPGGLIALITTIRTMDKRSPEARRYIAQRAELLGAIRLPNNAFKGAGTAATSDILFLQKRENPIEIEPDWLYLGKNEDGYAINRYFLDHPEMMLGNPGSIGTPFGRRDFSVIPIEGANLAVQLASAMQNIRGTFQMAELPDLGEGQPSQETIPADPDVKNYSYTVVDGEVYYRENSVMVRPTLHQTAKERIKGLVALRNCTNDLIQAQMDEAGDDVIHAHQQRLNSLYDDFSSKFGLISSRPNALAFQDDSSYYLLCSLEVLDGKGNLQRKADMFFKRTIRQHHAVEHVDTAAEALAVSIGERARVDLPYMAQLTGKEEKQITDELKGVIFCLPGTKAQYVTADEYLSGHVRQKLREAKLAAQLDTSFQTNVEALEAAQPKDLEASEIDVRLGATWVDKAYIQQFMEELLQPPFHLRRLIQVQFSPYSAEWRISGKDAISSSNIAAYTTYGTGHANAYHILEDTLNLRDVRIYDTVEDKDGKLKRVLNQKATTLAQQKQQAIKDAFRAWIWKNPERRHALVAVYNERFNAVRPRTYDGSHIVFGGMNPDISLREHQRNAIAHVLYGGNTLLAHVVGSGKTFEMVAACMESKRLGLSQKAMIVVPNHLTEQWGSEFLRLYPSANILVTTKKDFEKANRKKFCARIATGDYDAIIIGHSQFERIPISKKRQERLLNEQINEITAGIEELQHSHGERFSIKELERSRKQLAARLTKLQAEDKKDDVITFEQLGVDRLLVDEAHMFKNLFLTTKMRNVAGLSTSEAQKSSDMFAKCRYLDEITGGRGVVFATGTPVSNSMTELFTMQRYLQYDTLQRNNMVHFDCWASTFGETTTAIELAPEGTGYRARTRFAKFFNLPELMTMFREVADIKTADQLHLPTPTAHYETIAVKPTAEQEALVQALSERAGKIHVGAVDASVDNMLKVTTDGRKLGLDQRLLNPLLPDDPGSKVNVCVHNIHRIWEENSEQRLTQLVFCDISTPKGASKDGVPTEFSVYDDVRAKLIGLGIPKEEIAFIHDADTETKKKELFAKVRAGQVRVLMGSTQKMGAGTNCQDRLIALHDLDCPWRPGDLEQRAGRIVRQGNQNQDVYIYRYVTEKSFDSYLWQTVENKQRVRPDRVQ